MISIIDDKLTKNQKNAISHFKGPLIIIAGPGSGKTEVMIRRTAYLIGEKSVPPESILVVTFTNKAADQLKDRLYAYIGKSLEQMQVSTIHSFCHQMLDDYHEHHAYGRNFQLLDDTGQYLFVYAHLQQLGLDRHTRGKPGEFLQDAISAFNRFTEEIVDCGRLCRYARSEFGSDSGTPAANLVIAEAYSLYLELLRAEKLLDFASLQRAVHEMLENSEKARSEIQKRFEFIIVDEYQDTNAIQDTILRTVAEPRNNLCVVGDDDQSIYRFRGATVRNFLDFEKRYGNNANFKKIHIGKNFRSTNQIVETSQKLIEHNPPNARYPKSLLSNRGRGNDIVLVHEETWPEEADAAVRLVARLKDGGVIQRFGDAAILFSSVKFHSPAYIDALEQHGIPYTVVGDGNFFDREDVLALRDLIKYCGWRNQWQNQFFDNTVLLLKPSTVGSLIELQEDPVELDTVEKLKRMGIRNREDQRKLLALFKIKNEVLGKDHADILSVFYELMDATGYFERCCMRGDEEALLNLAQFSSIIDDFDRYTRSKNTYRFSDYLCGLPPKSIDELKLAMPDAVKIMTIHQAKGLEFPVVVIGSVVEGRIPKRRRGETFPLPTDLRLSKDEDVDDIHLLDQRKLFYVGMTRAEDILILGTSNKINARGSGPSRFIGEITEYHGPIDSKDDKAIARLIKIKKKGGIGGRPRERLSYSAINTYIACPLRYKFIYVYKFRLPSFPLIVYGQSLHRTLESIHLGALAEPGRRFERREIEEIYENNWIPIPAKKEEFKERFKNLGLGYIWTYVEEYSRQFDRIFSVEQTFSYPLDDFVVVGKIDLLNSMEDGGTVEVIDFKTRAWEGLAKMHTDLQLRIYATACQSTMSLNVGSISAHLLAENVRKSFDWNQSIANETANLISEIGGRIAAKEFPPNTGTHCSDCDFSMICPHSGVRQ